MAAPVAMWMRSTQGGNRWVGDLLQPDVAQFAGPAQAGVGRAVLRAEQGIDARVARDGNGLAHRLD
jgi:hypothetical protein